MVNLKVKLGIAPIAWTNDDMPDLGKENTYKQALSEMALAGFQGTELGRLYPRDLKILKPQLKLRNLKIAAAWFSAYILERGLEKNILKFHQHCQFLASLEAKVVVVSEQSYSIQGKKEPLFMAKPLIKSEEEWSLLAQGLNQLGQIAKSYGLKLAFHHHMGTLVQTFAETKKLMALTDPQLVFLVLDTGHFAYSGENPAQMILAFQKRIVHLHLKDIRSQIVAQVKKEKLSFLEGVRLGTFTIPSDGAIDFIAVFKALQEIDYEGWILVEAEQDPSLADPLAFAFRARAFLKAHVRVV